MREILLRGKDKNIGEWVTGNLYQNQDQCFIMANNRNNEVIPETVGQYTGLTGKNGRKIFEGDIVKAYLHNETMMIFPITFRAGCFWFGNWNFIEFADKFRNIEVIGNIYDNPELIEAER